LLSYFFRPLHFIQLSYHHIVEKSVLPYIQHTLYSALKSNVFSDEAMCFMYDVEAKAIYPLLLRVIEMSNLVFN